MKKPDINSTINQFLNENNPEGIGLIVDFYYQDMYLYGLKLGKEEQLVKDCIQDVLLEIWLKKDKLKALQNVKAYLLTAIRRRVIRVLEEEKRELQNLNTLYFQKKEISFDASVEELLVNEQTNSSRSEKLKKSLSRLSDKQKEIIYLKFYQELSYDEIAEVLEIKRQSAKNLLHESVKSLRKYFFSIWWLLFFL